MTPSIWFLICAAVVAMAILFIEPLRKLFALLLALAVAFCIGFFWPNKECQHLRVVEANSLVSPFSKR